MTPEEQRRFAWACRQVLENRQAGQGIGTLGEKSLHAVLKRYYQPEVSFHERKTGSMTVDAILPDGSMLEVQTRNFSSLRKKLPVLLSWGRVQLAAPVVQRKWVCWVHPETGEVISRRRSPKLYHPIDLSRELYAIRGFLAHPHLTLRIPLLEAEEYRLLDGWGSGGKRGSTRYERIPLALLGEQVLETSEDFRSLFPENLPEIFTVKDLEKAARISDRCARSAISIFRDLGLAEEDGCQGRAKQYRRL